MLFRKREHNQNMLALVLRAVTEMTDFILDDLREHAPAFADDDFEVIERPAPLVNIYPMTAIEKEASWVGYINRARSYVSSARVCLENAAELLRDRRVH
jgi:hypothetical protein